MMVRVYTGDDGESRFEELRIPGGETQVFLLQAGGGMVFHQVPEGRFLDWHTAPRRQFVITLTGQVEIGISDGTVRTLGPRDIMLADDLTVQGHTALVVSGPVLWSLHTGCGLEDLLGPTTSRLQCM